MCCHGDNRRHVFHLPSTAQCYGQSDGLSRRQGMCFSWLEWPVVSVERVTPCGVWSNLRAKFFQKIGPLTCPVFDGPDWCVCVCVRVCLRGLKWGRTSLLEISRSRAQSSREKESQKAARWELARFKVVPKIGHVTEDLLTKSRNRVFFSVFSVLGRLLLLVIPIVF